MKLLKSVSFILLLPEKLVLIFRTIDILIGIGQILWLWRGFFNTYDFL